MATWKELIADAMQKNGEEIGDLIYDTLTHAEMNSEFDDGYGGAEGVPFTAWSEKFVYFPIVYDGSEWVGSAPRNPCDIALEHQGGQ